MRPPLRLLLISDWTLNPYQKLFVAHLKANGVCVSEETPRVRWPTGGRPDVIHLQNVRPYLTSAGFARSAVRLMWFALRLMLARRRGARIVWTVHDLDNPSGRRRLDPVCTFMLARSADAMIVHSRTAYDRVLGEVRVRSEKLHVVPHGHYADHYADSVTREAARHSLGIREERVVFLLFGWISEVQRRRRTDSRVQCARRLRCDVDRGRRGAGAGS